MPDLLTAVVGVLGGIGGGLGVALFNARKAEAVRLEDAYVSFAGAAGAMWQSAYPTRLSLAKSQIDIKEENIVKAEHWRVLRVEHARLKLRETDREMLHEVGQVAKLTFDLYSYEAATEADAAFSKRVDAASAALDALLMKARTRIRRDWPNNG